MATLTGHLTAQDGKLVYAADALKLGGFTAPDELKSKVQRIVESGLNRLLGTVPGRVDRVAQSQGSITIQGVTD